MHVVQIKSHLRALLLALHQHEDFEVTKALTEVLPKAKLEEALAAMDRVFPPPAPLSAEKRQAVWQHYVDRFGRDRADMMTFGWHNEQWWLEWMVLGAMGGIPDTPKPPDTSS